MELYLLLPDTWAKNQIARRIAVNTDKVTENGKTRLTIVSGQTLRDLKEGKITLPLILAGPRARRPWTRARL